MTMIDHEGKGEGFRNDLMVTWADILHGVCLIRKKWMGDLKTCLKMAILTFF